MPIDFVNVPVVAGPAYHGQDHPIVPFDYSCNRCSLGCGSAVPGAGPEDLDKVKLVVLSEWPGHYETQMGWPQVPNSLVYNQERKGGKKKFRPKDRNSGQFIRELLTERYGLDTWNEVWFTNTIKCDPKDKASSLSASLHVSKCVGTWLRLELDKLPTHIPVLAMGQKALDGLKLAYPEDADKLKNLNACRRRSNLIVGDRFVTFTYNAAVFARSEPRIETDVLSNPRTDVIEVKQRTYWYPPIIGSPMWFLIGDLVHLDKFFE